MKRPLAIVLTLAACSTAAAFGWQHFRGESRGQKFTTTNVTRGDLTATVSATGQVQPVVNVQVGSQISGLIKELKVDFNSPVKQGEIIARLDDASFVAAVHSAQGNLAAATSDLHAAQLNAARNHELFTKALVAQSDIDSAESAVEKCFAAVTIAQANLEKAQLDLGHCTVTSPVDGIVTSRNVDVGQTVAASLSAPTLFTIAADLTKMQIVAEVTEGDIGQVHEGKKVSFTVDAYQGRTFTGTVAQVRYSPRTIDSVVNYDTVINVANDDLALLPGMTASTNIIVAERHAALLVPNAALRLQLAREPATTAGARSPGTRPTGGSRPRDAANAPRTLYTLANTPGATPQRERVRVGISDGQMTEILEGAQENSRVVVAVLGGTSSASTRPNGLLAGGNSGGGMGLR